MQINYIYINQHTYLAQNEGEQWEDYSRLGLVRNILNSENKSQKKAHDLYGHSPAHDWSIHSNKNQKITTFDSKSSTNHE